MIQIETFTFNPFQENTYLLHDETKECIIIDPGCYDTNEQNQLVQFIEQNDLNPVKLLNTHCHLDHIFGNSFIMSKYNLELIIHKADLPVLESAPMSASMYGVALAPSPQPSSFLEGGDVFSFGNSILDVLFTPGHSPGSICFHNKDQKFLIGGDVLFLQSIGRTDLPGGDHNTLIQSIKTKLFPLDDDTVIHPGHGPETNIGFEKANNPFVA